MLKRSFIFFGLIIILGIGAWLRFSGVLTNSFAFTYDVGRDMLAVKDIVIGHKLVLIGQTTGIEGIFYGPWWYLFLSIPFFLFSGDPQGIAFFMGIIGIVTVFLSFVVGKKIGGAFLGIIFSAFVAISPLMVASSSQIWNPNLIPFFCVLVLLILCSLSLDIKNEFGAFRNFLLLGLLLGLVADTEIVFGLLFFLSICAVLVLVLRKKLTIKRILFFILGLLLIFSPRIIFEFRHNFLMTRKAVSFFNIGSFSSGSSSIFDILLNRLEVFFNLWSDTLSGQNNTIGLILISFVFLILVIFYRKTGEIQKQFIKTIFIVIAFSLIGLTFFNHDIWPHYLVGLPIFYILFLSLSINLVRTVFKRTWVIIFLLIVLFWLNLNPMQVLNNIKKPVWEGNSAVYRNQLAVIDYVYADAKGQNFKYIVYTPAVHSYSYRYLFPWYGKKKYGYTPSEKSSLFYVILEPDYDLPFRLKDWLKIREKDGIIQKEEIVKGGITVQTRIKNDE